MSCAAASAVGSCSSFSGAFWLAVQEQGRAVSAAGDSSELWSNEGAVSIKEWGGGEGLYKIIP